MKLEWSTKLDLVGRDEYENVQNTWPGPLDQDRRTMDFRAKEYGSPLPFFCFSERCIRVGIKVAWSRECRVDGVEELIC